MDRKCFSDSQEYDKHFNVKYIGELDGIKIYRADYGYAPSSFNRKDSFTVNVPGFDDELWSKLVDEFERIRKPEGRDKLFLDDYQLDSLLELPLIENHETSTSKVHQCPRCLGKGKSVLVFSVEDPCSKCGGSGLIQP